MGEVVNLRQARKAKARRDREDKAAANRAVFGQTKGQARAASIKAERAEAILDGAKRDSAPNDR